MWRPKLKEGMVSIRREGKFFAVVCRTIKEANIVEKALIKALCKSRRKKKRRPLELVTRVIDGDTLKNGKRRNNKIR